MKDAANLYDAPSCDWKHSCLTRLAVVAYAIALAAFLAVAFFSKWEAVTHNDQYDIVHITISNPTVRAVIIVSAGLGALILMSIGVAGIWYHRICFGIITIIIACGGYAGSYIVSFLANPSPWTTEAEIVGPDGHTYYFMDSSFLQGQTMAIARLESNTILTRRVNVLGTNNGDWPRSWASVIRPAGAPSDDYGQLYVMDLGTVIGIRYDNKCYLAYDTLSGKFYGHGDVEEMSPFVLIGPNTLMHQPDVEAIIEKVKSGAEFLSGDSDIRRPAGYLAGETLPGYPRGETLTASLTHANPTVRNVAKRILDIHQAGLKKAGVRVDERVQALITQLTSEDSNVRSAAAQALGGIGGPGATPAIPALVVALRDEDSNVRLYASQSLGLIGQTAVPTLLQLLKDEDDSVRKNALFGLSMAGPAAESAIPALIETLKDKSASMRAKAAIALGNIGPKAAPAVPALINAMKDEDSDVRYFATGALENIGPAANEAILILTEALKDKSSSVRMGAARALEKIQP